ncbi:MOSC domain-containing protein [Streptomyces sp. SL13]|jgi:uncharacterized protein YcbX|uniref:MOSC domain-containing protein n=1 Tax=Streptantibioticus silvisoli TaxID=2705255 RepID=A0AA90KI07_9ACTN|nr:MOSC N-terminal beta barrel domain-containing protein [Streptantibioticus silvisoli]MDI5966725.1 MOSC domain-containing protein [Streptantibioticus silvisoli]MDI5972074.1 MOSC domain-containing protein [Streptantibioticus silvisoli]
MTSPRLSSLHVYPVKSAQGAAPERADVEPWGLAGDRRWVVVNGDGRAVTQREAPRMTQVVAVPQADGGIVLRAPGTAPLTVAVPTGGGTSRVWIFSTPVEAAGAAPEAAAWWSAFLGADLRLFHLDDPAGGRPIPPHDNRGRDDGRVSFADSHPLLLTSTASLAALNRLVARGDHAGDGPLPMNRFRPNMVVDGTGPWVEDDWRRVRVGEVVMRVVGPCARCVITTTDQEHGTRGKEPLRTLARHRRFGGGLMFGQNLVPESGGTLRVGDTFSVVE